MAHHLSDTAISILRAADADHPATSDAILTAAGFPPRHEQRRSAMVRFHRMLANGRLGFVGADAKGRKTFVITQAGIEALAIHTARQGVTQPPSRHAQPAALEPTSPQPPEPSSGLSGLEQAIESFARQLAASIFEATMRRIAAQLSEQVMPVIRVGLATKETPPEETPPEETPVTEADEPATHVETPPRRPRALIVGLLPGQQDIITREFGRELDLRFVTSQAQVSNRAKELSHTSDAAILMTKFVNHAAEDIIKSRGGRLIRVSGGLSQLRDTLTQFYCEQQG